MATEVKQQKEQGKEADLAWVDEVAVEKIIDDVADERVCCLLRGWRKIDASSGEMLLPQNRITYLDNIRFEGGVAHNVPIEMVKKWIRAGFIDKNMVFKNNSTVEDWENKLGRHVVAKGQGTATDEFSIERILALLGEEKAEALARELHRAASSRKEASNP